MLQFQMLVLCVFEEAIQNSQIHIICGILFFFVEAGSWWLFGFVLFRNRCVLFR